MNYPGNQHDPRPRARHLDRSSEGGELLLTTEDLRELRLPDRTGLIALLLDLADGSRTVAAIAGAVQRSRPEVVPDQVARVLGVLDRLGVLEDAAAPCALTDAELERDERNLAFFGTFASMERSRFDFHADLEAARVVLLGLGGIGSSIAMNLAGLGVGHLTIVDGDCVAPSNLNRQFLYDADDLGMPKVQRARQRILAINERIEVTTIARMLSTEAELAEVIAGHDLVVASIDHPVDVLWRVNRVCVAAGIPFVAGGVQGVRALYLGVDPRTSGCLDCDFARLGIAAPAPDERLGNRAIGPAVTIVGGLIALDVARYLTGFAPPVSPGRIWSVDLVSGAVTESARWSRYEGCPTCGEAALMPASA